MVTGQEAVEGLLQGAHDLGSDAAIVCLTPLV